MGFYIDIFCLVILLQIIVLAPANKVGDAFGIMGGILFGVVFIFAMFKDGFNGVGPGKWILGMQVVNASGLPIGFLDSLKRNVSMILWPVEAISILLTGNRVSDKYLHFEVIRKGKINWITRLVISIGVITGLIAIDFKIFKSKMLNEDSAIVMKEGILNDSDLAIQIGKIKEYGNLKSGTIQNNEAIFTSNVRTEKGEAEIQTEVKFENGKWIYKHSQRIER